MLNMAARVILLKWNVTFTPLLKTLNSLPSHSEVKGKLFIMTKWSVPYICSLTRLPSSTFLRPLRPPHFSSNTSGTLPLQGFHIHYTLCLKCPHPSSSTWLTLLSPSVLYSSYHLSEIFVGHSNLHSAPPPPNTLYPTSFIFSPEKH